MKSKIFTALLCAGLALLAIPAKAQVVPGYSDSFTNIAAVFTTTNSVTATTNVVQLHENTGLALSGGISTSAGANIPSGAWIWFSRDGTNYPPVPQQALVTPNGSTTVYWQTNYSAQSLAGYVTAKIQITNGCPGNLTNTGAGWHAWRAP